MSRGGTAVGVQRSSSHAWRHALSQEVGAARAFQRQARVIVAREAAPNLRRARREAHGGARSESATRDRAAHLDEHRAKRLRESAAAGGVDGSHLVRLRRFHEHKVQGDVRDISVFVHEVEKTGGAADLEPTMEQALQRQRARVTSARARQHCDDRRQRTWRPGGTSVVW